MIAVVGLVLSGQIAMAQERAPFFDDAGRSVPVPERPLRIVSLDDVDLTVPLLELGVVPIASQGRVGRTGFFLRSSLILTGLDFDNTGMAFLGMQPVDVEAVAALKPDLIITLKNRPTPVEQLQRIAPTVVLDETTRTATQLYAALANVTGRQRQAESLERRYRAQIGQLIRIAGAAKPTVAVLSATADGKISLDHTYGSLGAVLRDAGFPFPAIIDEIPENGSVLINPEALPELDVDVIFDTFRNDKGETPKDARDRMRGILPGYCQFLRACREGRYFIVTRDEAKSFSYAAKSMAVALIAGIMSIDAKD